MSINEIVTMAKDIIISFAAIATACLALRGLYIWKKELRWKTNFETARLLMESVYQLRDAISACRSSFTHSSEFPTDYSHSEKDSQKEASTKYLIYKERCKPIEKMEQEFNLYTLRAEALWGTEIREATDKLLRCLTKLFRGINDHLSDLDNNRRLMKQDYRNEIENIIWDSGEDNSFTKEINSIIQQIENKVRLHLN